MSASLNQETLMLEVNLLDSYETGDLFGLKAYVDLSIYPSEADLTYKVLSVRFKFNLLVTIIE